MAKIRFLYNDLAAAAASVAAASSAVSSLPAANAQNPDRTLVWRSSTGVGDAWVSFDLGSAQSVTAVAVANITIHPGGSAKVQWSTDNASWTDYGALPAADVDTAVTFVFGGTFSKRYWRIYFTNTGAVSSFVEAGYVFVGTYFEPTINVSVPIAAPTDTLSKIVESLDGQRSTTTRRQRVTGAWKWGDIPDADLTTLQTIYRTCDIGIPLFQVLDTTRSWTAWLVYFNGSITRTFSQMTGRYDVDVPWCEA